MRASSNSHESETQNQNVETQTETQIQKGKHRFKNENTDPGAFWRRVRQMRVERHSDPYTRDDYYASPPPWRG